MSISLISKAWPLHMQTGRKFVLVSLCDAASDEGGCFLCVDTIAYKTGMSIRCVQGHLFDLEKSGFINREERKGRSTIYSVNVVALEDAEKHEIWIKKEQAKRSFTKSAPPQNLHPPRRICTHNSNLPIT